MDKFEEEVSRALIDSEQKNNLWNNLLRMKGKRDRSMRELDPETLESLMEARRRTEDRLTEILSILKGNIERAGGRVYIAKTGEEAARYIAELAVERSVKIAVKSKSLTSREIMLNEHLESRGIEVIETDMGERIVQLAGQRPSHMLAPAVHMNRRQVASVISKHAGISVGSELEEIARSMRGLLRGKFIEADMGITGANVIVAECGAVVILTNEGNGRLVCSIPKLLVAVAGVEKVVYSWEDAFAVLRVLPRSATGREMPAYISIYGAERRGVKGDGDSEFHLVLIDNGRLEAASNQWLKEALRCIRCSACLDVCPTYRIVGGHVFGDVYSGPVGVLWTAITRGVEAASRIAPLCVSCGLCLDACPVAIDIPLSISWIKSEAGRRTLTDRALAMYEVYAKLGSKAPRLINWLNNNRVARLLLEKAVGIDRRRPLPRFIGGSFFEDGLEKRGERSILGEIKVAYFVDTYAAYIDWRIAELAVRLCERLGIAVEVPDQVGSGMPYIQYGFWDRAKKVASKNVKKLINYVRGGYYVICTEPTAAYCLKHVYPKILKCEDSALIARNTYEFLDFIVKKGLLERLQVYKKNRGEIFYHYPCHSRQVSPERGAILVLESLGYNVKTYDYGCCGMAGTWGMRRGPNGYDLSREIGSRVCSVIKSMRAECVVTESSVCLMQLSHLGGFKTRHVLEVVYEAVVNR